MKMQCNIKELILDINGSRNTLLKDIHFTLEPNRIYTIIGKNGSGKSTLIKALSLLLDKRYYIIDGELTADGRSLTAMPSEELRKFREQKIKYVFQDAMNSFDPLRTMGYYLNKFKTDKKEAEELLSYFLLPSYDKVAKMYPWELSGGMIQRFSMVFSMLLHPELLILDEPTSGLDSPSANLVLHKLKEYKSCTETSVLIITQDMSFAEAVSDYIAHIENKTLTAFASAAEYIKSGNLFAK